MIMALVSLIKLSLICFLALLSTIPVSTNANLTVGFYNNTCPNVEDLVFNEMKVIQSLDATLMPSLLRLHFHDCFVRGCDASVILKSKNGTAERDAPPNLTLRGFNAIDIIKAKLEKACPGIVSCSDILALAARDAVFLSNGPHYDVETGRRDGNVSRDVEALSNLPPADGKITELIQLYGLKNLTVKDLVVLSGAHTFGVSHCPSFNYRLYDYTGKNDQDPSLNATYAEDLKQYCLPNDNTTTTIVDMVPGNPLTFNLGYFQTVAMLKGLFGSDEALLHNNVTQAYVLAQANATSASQFFLDFGESMIHMGRIGVLTGTSGTIRAVCGAYVN